MNQHLDLSDDDIRAFGDGEPLLRDGLFPADAVAGCAERMAYHEGLGAFTAAGVGRPGLVDPALRGDRTVWNSDLCEPIVWLHTQFEDIRLELNASAWMGLASFAVQLAIFAGDGQHYVAHRDTFARDPARRATVILYLNVAWEPSHGGCLRVHPPSGTRDIEPVGGRLVLFRSDLLLHEVRPSYHRRYASTAWYR